MLERLKRWADGIRLRFDTLAKRIDSFGIVISLAAFTVAAMWLMSWMEPASCKPPPVRIIDLELTFSARRFAALLNALREAGCQGAFLSSLITTDILFPIAYATTLCAIYIWVERQRRFDPAIESRKLCLHQPLQMQEVRGAIHRPARHAPEVAPKARARGRVLVRRHFGQAGR